MLNGREIATLPEMDLAARLPRLTGRLSEYGCDGLLVTNLVNIAYLTGFTGSAGLLLVRSRRLVARHRRPLPEPVRRTGKGGRCARADRDRPASGPARVDRAGGEDPSPPRPRVRGHHLGRPAAPGERCSGAHKAGAGALGQSRRCGSIKDEGELARIERAADIADVALAQVKELLHDSPTEHDFAIALDFEMRRRGAEGVAFDTIVGSGPNGALPHARPSERRIEPGELVVVDFGATVEGYRCDMTRTLCVGEARSERAARARRGRDRRPTRRVFALCAPG